MPFEELRNKIKVLQDELAAKMAKLQEECCHPPSILNVTSSRSNSEWDQYAHYTTWYHCPVCEKRWHHDD